MTDRSLPFAAYQGSEPFIFVSYSHQDREAVYAELDVLAEHGLNVWYDEGISPGSRWSDELADAIERSAVFLVFLTPNSVTSENCVNEIDFATSRNKRMLAVYLEDCELPSGLQLSLGGKQAIMGQQMDLPTLRQKMTAALDRLLVAEPARRFAAGAPREKRSFLPWLAIAVALVALAFFSYRPSYKAPEDQGRRPAVAVLRFADLGSGEGEYFADSLAADLITRLASWRTLPVISRAASFNVDLPEDVLEVGERLDARYLVDGRINVQQDELVIEIELLDSLDGSVLHAQRFQKPMMQMLQVQQDISSAIVGEINPALARAEAGRALRADPENLDAWTAAQRGWWYVNQETAEGLAEARPWFEQAMELDPSWGWPRAALALTYYRELISGWSEDPPSSIKALVGLANEAVKLDAQDAFAHHALGHGYALIGNLDESLAALQRGVELNPNDAMASGCLGMQLAASNRSEEAIAAIDHAMSISPNDPWSHRYALGRARAHFAGADYAQAEDWAMRSLQLKPGSGAFLHSVASPAMLGEIERAVSRAEAAKAIGPLPPLSGIESSFLRSTHPDYVARLVEGLRRGGFPE